MANATPMSPSETLRERAPAPGATIRPEEAAHFGRLAADWWDPKGTSAMLHQLNPVRLGFIRTEPAVEPGKTLAPRPATKITLFPLE